MESPSSPGSDGNGDSSVFGLTSTGGGGGGDCWNNGPTSPGNLVDLEVVAQEVVLVGSGNDPPVSPPQGNGGRGSRIQNNQNGGGGGGNAGGVGDG